MMNDKTREILLILQEECAEVTQAVSKVFRFGFDSCYPTEDSASTKECLELEVGDLLCMIDLLIENGIVSDSMVNQCRKNKREKLKIWSGIFK
jgi:NTP pyrophosphatase (non-canonical NTP hydrolase)